MPAKGEIEKCDNPCDSNLVLKDAKKERRKPELQRYRPGQGLQNKNLISSKKSDKVDNDTLQCVNNSVKLDNVDDSTKSSKHIKNRRPDIQVYTPKAKAAAKLPGKASTDFCSSKWEDDSVWKNSNSHCDRHNSSEDKSDKHQHIKKENTSVQKNKTPKSDSPKVTASWADCVEEADLLNSHGLPDKCNGYSDNNVHLHLSNSATNSLRSDKSNRPINQKSNKDDYKQKRNKRGNRRNDSYVPISEGNSKESEFENKNWPDTDLSSTKHCDDVNKKNTRMVRESGTSSDEHKGNTNSLDRIKLKHVNSHSAICSDSKGYTSEYNGYNKFPSEVKCEKKKRDKESTLPPRFQKQKALDANNHRSGGILKIPVEQDPIDSPTEMMNKLHIPKLFPEPPKMFIHKQLFDPNNPSKPEIVNIPAPIPPPHVPYGKINQMYCLTDGLNSPYIPAPVESGVYIPPPQPPVSNPQFRFMQSDMCATNVQNNYVDIRESGASMQCQIPQMNNMFSSPSHAYVDMPPDSGKKRIKPLVERNLYDIVLIEKELSSALSKSLLEIDLDNLNKIRYKLQLRYENIILADPKYCAEKNPEQSLWKTSYHQIIEAFRKKLEEDQKNSEKIKETLFKLIIEGTVFYENLLEKQQEAYGFKLTKLLDVEHINTSGFSDQMRIVLISVQKHLIYLGDLARYKEQISQTSNYGKARSWYLKAQKIAPKNGKPYHQLALLAFNTKRKLDAVYYYMRSLAASNPFLSAKESLLSLFEEAKIKYEIYEKKRTKESSVETEILENQTAERTEVWIKNDGSSSQLPAEAEKSNAGCELKKLSDVEINKRFITSFLHVHGKLFTKVGMDTFPDALKNMLTEFYFLLQRSPIPLTSVRLLQLLAINIFSVTNSSLKENGREHGGESLLQEQALYTSMAMMSLMMDRCCLLQVAHKSSSDHSTQLIADDFVTLLPSIKTWTDWMSCQKCLWPPPSLRILENAQSNNIWTSFAAFLSVLQDIDTAKVEILTEPCPNSEPIILDEDKLFAGFVPVLGAIQVPSFAVQPFDKITAKHCARISKIQFFGDYLCGICPPYLKFDVTFKRFVALVNFSFKETSERSVLLSSDESFGEVQLNDELNDAAVSRNSLSNEFQVLKSRKEALSRAREQQQKYQAQVQAVLHEHQNQRLVLLKIKPRVLVPDTNCFVDHLKLFKNILASTDFHLVIPLVVINELDGLARGTRVNDHTSSGHASRVTVLAREAVTFLEEQFALRHPHLRSITSKGSTLDTISFRSEEISQNKGTNDDLILSCCLNYCKDRAENYMPKTRDEPITLFREVVLLTDDRNLRIKALAHHVPVRDLLSFLQWANA